MPEKGLGLGEGAMRTGWEAWLLFKLFLSLFGQLVRDVMFVLFLEVPGELGVTPCLLFLCARTGGQSRSSMSLCLHPLDVAGFGPRWCKHRSFPRQKV